MRKVRTIGASIADVPFQVESDSSEVHGHVTSVLKNYVSPIKNSRFCVCLNTLTGRERFESNGEVEIIRQNGRFVFVDRGRKRLVRELGFVDTTRRICQLSVDRQTAGVLFHPFLMSCFSLFLSEEEGFLVHAAGIIYQSGAYLFVGASGSGKTTVASVARKKGLEIISDEKVIIRRSGSSFLAHSSPWYKDANRSVPLRKIFFLEKSNKVVLRRLKPLRAAGRILLNVTFNIPDRVAAGKILNTVCLLCRKVSSYEMEFAKDGSFWHELGKLE